MALRDRLLAFLVAVLWGLNFLAVRIGLDHFPPFLLASIRFLVLALPVVLFVPRPKVPWRWLIGYGLGFGVGQFGFLFLGMELGLPTGLASLVLQSSAPFTVLLGALLLRERLSARQVIGVCLAVGGLAAIGWSRSTVAPVLPFVLALLAGLSWAFGNLCSRKADSEEPMRFMLWMSIVPPIPMFALSWIVEGPAEIGSALAASVTATGWPGLAALGYIVVCATVLGQGIWTALLARNPAGVVAPYCMLVPVVGMATAAVVLGERPTWVEVVAGVVIVIGVLYGTPRGETSRGAKRAKGATDEPTAVTQP